MAVSTTQSIWRSGGGDQTRTAYCGTGLMIAQFYIADAGPASTANVKVSSATGAPNLILPAGAVVTGITIHTAATASGTFDLGWVTQDGSPSDTDGLLVAATAATGNYVFGDTEAGNDFGLVMDADELVTITVTDNISGAGALTGYITYYVTDPLVGQQSV
jgi:hypothetical protein